jgi:hypothetical protein
MAHINGEVAQALFARAEGSAMRPSVLPNAPLTNPKHPSRLVIPSEAEGSAVRPSVLPNAP